MKFKNKKGQIKLMENVFVVFILIFIGLIVLIVYSLNNINVQKQKFEEKNFLEGINTIKLFMSFPEVECSIEDEIKENCIDLYKAKAFKKKIGKDYNTKKVYFQLLGYSNITIHYLNESLEEQEEINLYDFKKKNYNTKNSFQLPILTYNNTYTFGYIEVQIYR